MYKCQSSIGIVTKVKRRNHAVENFRRKFEGIERNAFRLD